MIGIKHPNQYVLFVPISNTLLHFVPNISTSRMKFIVTENIIFYNTKGSKMNKNNTPDYISIIKNYIPYNAQEEQDKIVMLDYIHTFPDTILTRKNIFAHMTASSLIFNRDKDKLLMIYHNIFKSWSWTGGHADGDNDFMQIAIKEAKEETGILNLIPMINKIAALDILPVWHHVKNGKFISSHQHLNLCYVFYADEKETLRIKEDENSGVAWIPIKELDKFVTEPDMLPVYDKIIERVKMIHN